MERNHYFLVRYGNMCMISKQYEEIIRLLIENKEEELEIMEHLIKCGLPDTQAALLCAKFIEEYAEDLE